MLPLVRFSHYIYMLITAILLLVLTAYINGIFQPPDSWKVAEGNENNGCTPRYGTDFQAHVTPEDTEILQIASHISSIEEAYVIATQWAYVSDRRLNGVDDRWSSPYEFLTASPSHYSNPVPGMVAGDCEEQANTLAAIIRALGVPPEYVRVVLGLNDAGSIEKGHVWVEVYISDTWYILDPSTGYYWDDDAEQLVQRKGLPFDYYLLNEYPVSWITAYYNDKYYCDYETGSDSVPLLWQQDISDINPKTISGIE